MKLLKRDRAKLERILIDAKEGLSFLNDPDTAIMRKTLMISTDVFSSSYYGEKYHKIMKEAGSKYCFILTAISSLEKVLGNEKKA